MCFHTCNLHSLYKHNIGKYWNLEILNIFLDIAIYLFIYWQILCLNHLPATALVIPLLVSGLDLFLLSQLFCVFIVFSAVE